MTDQEVVFHGISMESFTPSPESVIVLRFRFDEVDLERMRYMTRLVQQTFPDNAVMCLPHTVSIREMHNANLENLRNQIDDILHDRMSVL